MDNTTLAIFVAAFGLFFCLVGIIPVVIAIRIGRSRRQQVAEGLGRSMFPNGVPVATSTPPVNQPDASEAASSRGQDAQAGEFDAMGRETDAHAAEFDPVGGDEPAEDAEAPDEWGETKFGFDESEWDDEFDRAGDDEEPEIRISTDGDGRT